MLDDIITYANVLLLRNSYNYTFNTPTTQSKNKYTKLTSVWKIIISYIHNETYRKKTYRETISQSNELHAFRYISARNKHDEISQIYNKRRLEFLLVW